MELECSRYRRYASHGALQLTSGFRAGRRSSRGPVPSGNHILFARAFALAGASERGSTATGGTSCFAHASAGASAGARGERVSRAVGPVAQQDSFTVTASLLDGARYACIK